MPKAHILIVEDDWIVAEDTKITLKKLGFGVSGIVTSGEESLKKVEVEPPDLVLMDIKLEGEMGGIEAAARIRDRFNIPVVYVTGYADEDMLEKAKVTEPFGYIIKPFEDRELNSVIEISLYKHKMETKLKESEAWLYTTLKSIGDAVITTDTKGIVTFMNPVAQSLTGWRLEEAMGMPLTDVFNIINEETRKEVENPAARVLREGKVVELANHTLLIAKGGTEIPIDDSGAPIVDEKGDIIGVVLVFRDVGEKRDAEKALRKSDSLVNTSGELMSVLDRNYIYQTVNDAYLTAHKKTRADIVGHSVGDLIGQDVFEKTVKGYLNRCLSGETVEYGLWFDFPGTGHRYMDVAYYPFREKGGRISGVVVCSRDRTEQKRSDDALAESNERLKNAHAELEQRVRERTAELQESNEELADEIEERTRMEEALSKNEQHLRSFMENAKGFILYRLMVDPKNKYKGHVVFVSPSIEDIMGVSLREDFSEWFKNIHEDDLPSVMKAHKKSTETGVLFDQLMRIYHPGKGEWRWIRAISNPVFDSDGNPAYYNGLMVDITAKKRAEEKLEKLQTQLVRSERLAATGQLAASIAHEINSPLQAVTFMLSAIGERWENEKELLECIRILQGAFQSIRDTVKNLLDLNRPGKDEKQQTDVNRVIEKTIDLVQSQLKKSDVTLNADLSPRIPGLTASPQGLSHIFLNLFNNAIEAMTGISKPHEGETGLIRCREINVKTNLGKGHVVIKVTDNGPGIPKEDMEHIFDPFYTRKKKMGLGVGLSVCHDIVKSHGGTITAGNGPEGGAVFTIKLPLD